jgi:Secretion system C-terminal sorting domain
MQNKFYTLFLCIACVLLSTALFAQKHYLQLVEQIDSATADHTNRQSDFVAVGSETFFLSTKRHISGGYIQTLYRTDGTASGTSHPLSMSIPPSNNSDTVRQLVALNSRVLLLRSNAIKSFDTQNGNLIDLIVDTQILVSVAQDGFFYFVAKPANSLEYALYRTDGTTVISAPLAVLTGTNTNTKAQITAINNQIVLCYTTANKVHLSILPQGSTNLLHLQETVTPTDVYFSLPPIAHNATIFWAYRNKFFKTDGTVQGSVETTLPGVQPNQASAMSNVLAWTSFANRIVLVTKDSCTLTTINDPNTYTKTCPIRLVTTDGFSIINQHLLATDSELHTSHNLVFNSLRTQFFKTNQGLYLLNMARNYNVWANNEEYISRIDYFNNIDSLPTRKTRDIKGKVSGNELVTKDNAVFFYVNGDFYDGKGSINDYGLYKFNLQDNILSQIDERKCVPLTLANGVIYTSALHRNGAQQPFKIDNCSVYTPPLTNVRYDTTGTDIKLRWSVANNSPISNFEILQQAYPINPFPPHSQSIDTISYNPAQTDYFYAFAKPTKLGYSNFKLGLKTNSTQSPCADTLMSTAFSHCVPFQPNIEMTAMFDSTTSRSLISWYLASNSDIVDTTVLYKNNIRLEAFWESFHHYTDTAAQAGDVYLVKMYGNNTCTGVWERSITPQTLNCVTQQWVSIDTIYNDTTQEYTFKLKWAAQANSTVIDSFSLRSNTGYNVTVPNHNPANGIYTHQMTVPAATQNYIFYIQPYIAHTSSFPLCYAEGYLKSDTISTRCPYLPQIQYFRADTVAGINRVKLTWKVSANLQNIDNFYIYDNDQFVLTIPAIDTQTTYEYTHDFNLPTPNHFYSMYVNAKNACTPIYASTYWVSTICHENDRVVFKKILQTKNAYAHTLDFDVPQKTTEGMVKARDRETGRTLTNQWETDDKHYRYLYTCRDFLAHTIDLTYAELAPENCLNNSKTVIINCDVTDYEVATLLPNPANTQFTIALPDKKMSASVRIFNANGTQIDEFKQYYNTFSVDCSAYSRGLYMVEINDGSTVAVLKLIKL